VRLAPLRWRHPACPGLSDAMLGALSGQFGAEEPTLCPSRGWSAANRSSSGCTLSHAATHKSTGTGVIAVTVAAVGSLVSAPGQGSEINLEDPLHQLVGDCLHWPWSGRWPEGCWACSLISNYQSVWRDNLGENASLTLIVGAQKRPDLPKAPLRMIPAIEANDHRHPIAWPSQGTPSLLCSSPPARAADLGPSAARRPPRLPD